MSSRFALRYVLVSCFIAVFVGCGTREKATSDSLEAARQNQTSKPISVLFVDDDGLSQVIARQWAARTGGEIEVKTTTAKDLIAKPLQRESEVDVIVYPPQLIGELVANKSIEPITAKRLQETSRDRSGMLRHDRLTIVNYGKESYATSLGHAVPMILVRNDLLEALEIEIPATWTEFSAMCDRLRDGDGDLKANSGQSIARDVAIPLADGWAANMLLARSIPYVRQSGRVSTMFQADSMKPLIDTPPFVRALDELAIDVGVQSELLTPKDCYERIANGKAAVAVTWPSAAWGSEIMADPPQIRVGLLPSAAEYYRYQQNEWLKKNDNPISSSLAGCAGRLISMTSFCRSRSTATRFLSWIIDEEINGVVSVVSPQTLLVRSSQLAKPYSWVDERMPREFAEDFADAIRSYHSESKIMTTIRIAGQDRYMAVLNEAVLAVINDGASSSTALQDVAAQWEIITNEIGRESQIEGFQKSVGVR